MKFVDAIRQRIRPPAALSENAEARRTLVARLPEESVGLEVGVWKGDFSAKLLKELRPARLHLVDPWTFQSDVPKAWYGGASAQSQLDMDRIHDAVAARFAKEIASGVVLIHRCGSVDAASQFVRHQLDWVYIDGDHRYEAVRDELALFADLVKPGGYIAGDDYHAGGWWDGGVQRAADEWVAATDLAAFEVIGSQFLARLPG